MKATTIFSTVVLAFAAITSAAPHPEDALAQELGQSKNLPIRTFWFHFN
jgi:hypothetical protein